MTTRLAIVYRQRLARLRVAAGAAAIAAWDALPVDDIERYATTVVPVVAGLQEDATVLTSSYLSTHISAATGELAEFDLDPSRYTIETLRGVPAASVYARPAKTLRRALSEGVSFEDAVARGRERARATADTDVQLAARAASRDVIALDPRIVGYRRVLGPGPNCALCVVASTQRYHKEDLLPIHPNCGCGVQPIIGTAPIERSILDPDRLQYVKEQADDYSRAALSRLKIDAADLPPVKLVSHGELGPVLYDARHRFDRAA